MLITAKSDTPASLCNCAIVKVRWRPLPLAAGSSSISDKLTVLFSRKTVSTLAPRASEVWSSPTRNPIGTLANEASTNQFSVRANGGVRLVTGGAGLTLDGSALARLDGSQTFSAALNTFGDIALENGSAAYHHLQLSGGNALGYLYGSFPAYADGIHLGYNFYADANGSGHVFNTGGATSRVTAGYGFVGIYIGGVNAAPNTQRLLANSTGVTVNGTFNNSSDRNAKQDFSPVSPLQILEKLAQLPLSEWSYKEDPSTRHLGPMGQDFYSTFNIGTDEKHIAPIDEGGVALAAIQGLNEVVKEKDARISALEKRSVSLENRLAALEKLVVEMTPNETGRSR